MTPQNLSTSVHTGASSLYGGRCLTVDPLAHPFRLANGGAFPVTSRAFHIQHERALRHGQRWSPEHASALFNLHHTYVLTARGFTRGRVAWPLAVGTGKSESLVAFVKAQYEEHAAGRQAHTLLVCMEQVRQLSDLYRAITSTGVPASFVGVYHLKSEAEVSTDNLVAPCTVAEASTFRVLLATHSKMLKGDRSIADVNTFEGHPRDLVVWDESLIKSRGYSSDLLEIEEANALFGISCRGHKDAEDAHAFITARLAVLREAFEAARGDTVVPVEVSPEDELRYSAGLTEVLRRKATRIEAHKVLSMFLDHVQRPVRVLRYTDEGRRLGLIHFETLISPALRRLIVLDASHNIRLLTGEHDKELTVTKVNCAVKSFEDVTVKTLKHAAGRDALDKSLSRRDSAIMREIIAEVRTWPADRKGLIVTFRLRGSEERRGKAAHAELIRRALIEAGIPVDGRITFITWGQHTGVNDHGDADRVLLVGVLRRAELELSSAVAGQRGDLASVHAADLEELKRVQLSEMFHNVMQAAGRGRCRHTVDGKAQPMALSVICNEDFQGHGGSPLCRV